MFICDTHERKIIHQYLIKSDNKRIKIVDESDKCLDESMIF